MGKSPLDDRGSGLSLQGGQNEDSQVNVSGIKYLVKDEKIL